MSERKPTQEQIIAAILCMNTGMLCQDCSYNGKCSGGNAVIRDAVNLIESQASELAQLRAQVAEAEWHDLWADPNDLPPCEEEVLVDFGDDRYLVAYRDTTGQWVYEDFKTGGLRRVAAMIRWKHIEPPKEVDNGETD